MEESGEMTEEKWRERHDWVEASMRTLEMAKFGKDGGRSRKERDDWKETETGGENWRQKRGSWRVVERD